MDTKATGKEQWKDLTWLVPSKMTMGSRLGKHPQPVRMPWHFGFTWFFFFNLRNYVSLFILSINHQKSSQTSPWLNFFCKLGDDWRRETPLYSLGWLESNESMFNILTLSERETASHVLSAEVSLSVQSRRYGKADHGPGMSFPLHSSITAFQSHAGEWGRFRAF